LASFFFPFFHTSLRASPLYTPILAFVGVYHIQNTELIIPPSPPTSMQNKPYKSER